MKEKKPLRYAAYAGLAFQFLASILLGIMFGRWLDSFHHWSVPVWSLTIPVIMVVAVLVRIVRDTAGKK